MNARLVCLIAVLAGRLKHRWTGLGRFTRLTLGFDQDRRFFEFLHQSIDVSLPGTVVQLRFVVDQRVGNGHGLRLRLVDDGSSVLRWFDEVRRRLILVSPRSFDFVAFLLLSRSFVGIDELRDARVDSRCQLTLTSRPASLGDRILVHGEAIAIEKRRKEEEKRDVTEKDRPIG